MEDGPASSDDFSQVSGSKVVLLPNGVSPCNSIVAQMISQIKPKIVELVESANMLKMWVTFLIPRIEDGNNFGVSVQVLSSRDSAYFHLLWKKQCSKAVRLFVELRVNS